ncbi:hypothetical protein [Haematobacter massiliensis]|uniref:hypothetical protein n=1 Tax=Haematobacter massiliensis TaxID=195105 RepID=UPI00103F7437|nr:hypothetical protein [Haematobacter massiliensis]QBJ24006.1 hypothetical protein HmaOT1_06890 [Haematobacter massiliensis]
MSYGYSEGYGGLSSLDYWRLADELSVIDAAILITGNDPAEKKDDRDEHGYIIGESQRRNYEGYEAVFKALRLAVLSNRLRATVALRARDEISIDDSYNVMGEILPRRTVVDANADEVVIKFDTLIRASGYQTSIFSNRSLATLHNATTLYVLKEPAWDETTILVDDLKAWLSSKGLAPAFFFPQGRPEGFRDSTHPRYSPKLACAVAAWEEVKKPKPNMSAKATVEEWVKANAVRFGMVGSDGVPASKAVSEVSAVVNWATGGGAVPTHTGTEPCDNQVIVSVENFGVVRNASDEGIPF